MRPRRTAATSGVVHGCGSERLSLVLNMESCPARLVLVRHAESVGNVADLAARRAGAPRLDLDARDADVPLSETGVEQAEALGRHLGSLPADAIPTAVVSSPYRRAAQTAETALSGAAWDVAVSYDERLRERELGIFDGLTGAGIRAEYPTEASRREHLGKFYYRPPGGESWCDVALRVRSFLRDVGTLPEQDRLWVFTHQAVITCFRYVLEEMDEAQVMTVDRDVAMPNASITTYRRGAHGSVELVEYASPGAVQAEGAQPTLEASHAGQGES
jgi:broad specificity phosphatase PhoE